VVVGRINPELEDNRMVVLSVRRYAYGGSMQIVAGKAHNGEHQDLRDKRYAGVCYSRLITVQVFACF